MRKRLKYYTHHHFGMDWVCNNSKIGESILICGPNKQVFYREQQNRLIRSCLKSHNWLIPPLYHLNSFPDLLAPADSISPFQKNGEFLNRSSVASWAALQPARLWTVEPGLPAQCQAWRRGKVQCCSMWQWKTCQDGQIFAPHSSSDSLSSAMLIIHKLSVQ